MLSRKLINKLPAQPFFGYYRLLLSLFGRFGYIYTAHDDDVVADRDLIGMIDLAGTADQHALADVLEAHLAQLPVGKISNVHEYSSVM